MIELTTQAQENTNDEIMIATAILFFFNSDHSSKLLVNLPNIHKVIMTPKPILADPTIAQPKCYDIV